MTSPRHAALALAFASFALLVAGCGGSGGGGGGGATAAALTSAGTGSSVAATATGLVVAPQGDLTLLADSTPLDGDGDGTPDVAPDALQLVIDALGGSSTWDATRDADVRVDRPDLVAVHEGAHLVALRPGEVVLTVRLDGPAGPLVETRRLVVVEGETALGPLDQLEAYPATRQLPAAAPGAPAVQQLRVTGRLADGTRRDVTRALTLQVIEVATGATAPLADVNAEGLFVAETDGEYEVVADDATGPVTLARLTVGAPVAPVALGLTAAAATPGADPTTEGDVDLIDDTNGPAPTATAAAAAGPTAAAAGPTAGPSGPSGPSGPTTSTTSTAAAAAPVAATAAAVDPLKRFKDSKNPLDKAALAGFTRLGVTPVEGLRAGAYLRRVTIDLLGRPPTEAEQTAFLADPRITPLVDKLLGSREHARHWANDILAPLVGLDAVVRDPDVAGKTYEVGQALANQLQSDLPLGDIVERIATGSGVTGEGFDAAYQRGMDGVDALAGAFAGATVECARCHDHRLTTAKDDPKWTQKEAYGLYAFFQPGTNPLVLRDAAGNRVQVPPAFVVDGAKNPPAAPPPSASVEQRRRVFGQLLTKSRAFATTTAHRVWVEVGPALLPPGDVREATLAKVVTPEVLTALADTFTAEGTSLRKLLRTIVRSHLYRLSTAGAADARRDKALARHTVRRNRAEVVAHSLGLIASKPATPWLDDASLLRTFGYANPRADRPRRDDVNLFQAQVLQFSPQGLHRDLSGVRALAASVDAGTITRNEAVRTLYRRALSRYPSSTELQAVIVRLNGVPTPEALEDVAVALSAASEAVLR
jgi:hypothetical protein